MKKSANNGDFVSLALHLIGFALCIIPPAVCTIMYFPLWKEGGYASCIAGGTVLLLALCVIPIYKLINKKLTLFSSYMIWLALFILFFALSRIADQMTVISFVGFVSNLIGAVFFVAAKKRREADRK